MIVPFLVWFPEEVRLITVLCVCMEMRFVCAYPTLLNLQVVFCQAWQMVELSKRTNSSKFKAVRSPSPGGDLHPEAMPWAHVRDQSPASEQTLGNVPLSGRLLWRSGSTEGALPSHHHFCPSFSLFHAFQMFMPFESTMVMLLALFSCFSCSMSFWYERKKSAWVRSHLLRERSIGN